MRTRGVRRLSMLLLTAVLALAVPSAGFADDHGEEEDDFLDDLELSDEAVEEEEGFAMTEPETMGSLADIKWAPVGLNRMTDLMFIRPLTAGLTGLSAVTYGLAVGPTALTGGDMSGLFDRLIDQPWRYLLLRPLGEPMEYTED